MNTKDTEILSQIKQAVLAVDADAELILFGSRARGDYKEDSDWDVLLLTSKAVDLKLKRSFRRPLFSIERESEMELNTTIINKEDWQNKFNSYPLYYEIKKDGIAL